MILSTPTLILPPLKGEESFLETWMPRSLLRGSSLNLVNYVLPVLAKERVGVMSFYLMRLY